MSPCFAGVSLWILEQSAEMEQKQVFDTADWNDLALGRELMHRNVNVLLCAGINRFLWGSLQGYGIEVVPDAIGAPEQVLELWRSGKLIVPDTWPHHTQGGSGKGHRKRRGRRGAW